MNKFLSIIKTPRIPPEANLNIKECGDYVNIEVRIPRVVGDWSLVAWLVKECGALIARIPIADCTPAKAAG